MPLESGCTSDDVESSHSEPQPRSATFAVTRRYLWMTRLLAAAIGAFVTASVAGVALYYIQLPRAKDERISVVTLDQATGDPSFQRQLSGDIAPPRPDLNDLQAFAAWQTSLREKLWNEVFELPPLEERVDPEQVVHEDIQLESGVRRQLISYSSWDGTRIPAYLFTPEGTESRPGILVIPGHGRGIVETAGIVGSYQHRVAERLAQAGYIVLTPETRGFGQLWAEPHGEHRLVAFNALASGTFFKALVARDLKVATDLLIAHPQVDNERLAITGASFGGEMATTYGALDTRYQMVISQSFSALYGHAKSAPGPAQPHFCHLIPNQNRIFRFEDLFLLICPRRLFVIKGLGESPIPGEFRSLMHSIYGRHNAGRLLTLAYGKRGHEYYVEEALEYLSEHF